jgi:hypothetical protein
MHPGKGVTVGFSALHEGRGAGKTAPMGGHRLVNKKRIVSGKEKLQEKWLGKNMLILKKSLA